MAIEVGFRHGSYYSELATSIVPPVKVENPVVVIGTAPSTSSNAPVLCNSMSEFRNYFGWSNDFNSFTLCEAAEVAFSLFNVAPIVCINVLDVEKHTKSSTKTLTGVSSTVTLSEPLILSTLTAKSGETDLVKDTDYAVLATSAGVVISILNPDKLTNGNLVLSYKESDATKVVAADVVAGIENVEAVYPRLGVVPGTIIAPKWSCQSAVAAALRAKTRGINGCFNTICAVDLDTSSVTAYGNCSAAKNANSLSDSNMIVCWPKVSLDGVQYHLSTQVAMLMCLIDYAEGDGVPYVSPSNHSLQCDSAVLTDGTEIYLSKADANYLNSVGVTTALNFAGGFRAWNNRTAVYPANTDPKDAFIAVRRMMSFLGNSVITTFFAKVDAPINKRLIESITDSVNIWLNGLAARGAILGGRIYFDETINPLTDLLNGNLTFNMKVGFAVPAEVIEFQIEFDPSYFSKLFS